MNRPLALVFTFSLTLAVTGLSAVATKPSPPPDVAAPPADAIKSPTGLFTKKLVDGTGAEMPTDDDLVKIRYAIFASDGRLVDWIAPPQFVVVPTNTMMSGMKETVEMMRSGERRRAWIPERLGAKGKAPAGGYLVADVELLDVVRIPVTPSDIFAPPATATVTKSGLAYRILRHGHGTRHPKVSDTVVVNYTGWTQTGHLIDSSVLRGEPAEFPLTGVIAGWREALQLMVPGDRARIWVPEKLAYAKEPDKPKGMLVFDIELIDIK